MFEQWRAAVDRLDAGDHAGLSHDGASHIQPYLLGRGRLSAVFSRRVPTSVALLTTSRHGQWHGATVTTAVCVSSRPDLIQVSLSTRSTVADAVSKTGRFVLSFLGEQHRSVAERFAGTRPGGRAAFAGLATESDAGQCPYLSDANMVVRCRLWRVHLNGDQVALSGEVLGSFVADPMVRPLIFYSGRYHGVGAEVPSRTAQL